MDKLIGSAIVGQSGGPTSVINASVYGAFYAALRSDCITNVYGAANGIKGVLEDRLYDISKEDEKELELLLTTPASALGSCRYKLKDASVDDTDYKRMLEIFKKYNVRYFFYNGGNDSMDTCNKISKYMQNSGWDIRVMGIPKTVDNDLWATDHCPGYASAVKYIATSIMELSLDVGVYDLGVITVVEIMGRNAGWLTAGAALACESGLGPDLIYLPEIDFDMEKFLNDVQEIYAKNGKVMIAVSEGIHDKDGKYISEYGSDLAKQLDSFGHAQMGGLAATLADIVKKHTGAKVRGIELSLLQRCASHCASKTDIDEAFMSGVSAVEFAIAGMTDKMVGFERVEGAEYKCKAVPIDLTVCANQEKMVPREWINEAGNHVTQEFIEYARPLIQGETTQPKENGLPRFANLKKIIVK